MSDLTITVEPAAAITIQVDQLLIQPQVVIVEPSNSPTITISDNADIQQHISNQDNPHQTTAAQVGADPSGTAFALVQQHTDFENPHPNLVAAINVAIQGLQSAISELAPLSSLNVKQDYSTILNLLSALSLTNGAGKVITVNQSSNGFLLSTPASNSGNNGIVIKALYTERNDYLQISSVIASSSTTPNQTNGTEIFNLSLNPASASSKILVRGNVQFYNGASNPLVTLALFRNAETNPLRVWTITAPSYSYSNIPYSVRVSALGTTQETYRLRIGTSNAGLPINLNRIDNNTFMGNFTGSSIEVLEYAL